MAGTLQVNEHSAWTPAGWIFNNILERVALRLEPEDEELANEVFDALGPSPGHLDLCLVSVARMQRFTRAAEEVERRAQDAGASAFPDQSFYTPFIQELQQMLQLLHADPRTGSE